jgi:large subunit ribosomal protein L53
MDLDSEVMWPPNRSFSPITPGDGKKLSFQADEYNIDHIMNMVNKHAKKLEEIEQAKA